jgi:hypothetical protein
MKNLILTLTIVLSISLQSKAQKVYDIVGHARGLVSNAIADADRSANYTVNHTANELNVLIYTANQLLGDQMDKQVGQLKEQNRLLMNKIVELSNKIETGQSTIVHLEDNLILDLNNILGNVPFIEKEFIMKRAIGFDHLYKNEGEYQITLTGSNFGFNSDKVKVKFNKISIEDVDITSKVNLNQNIDNNTKKIGIPASTLNPYFDNKVMKPVKLSFEIIREEYKGLFGKKWKETGKINNSIYIYLFPNYSGVFNFDLTYEVYDWIADGEVRTRRTGPNAHCSSGCKDHYGIPFDIDISVAGGNNPPKKGDYKLANCDLRLVDGPGGFDADQSCNIINNQTTVTGHVRARTRPTTYELSANRFRYDVKSSEIKNEQKEFEFNKIYKLIYPKTLKLVVITGKSISSGQTFSYNITQSNTIFELISQDEINGEIVFQFKLIRPTGQ